jgi:hypothetical protein
MSNTSVPQDPYEDGTVPDDADLASAGEEVSPDPSDDDPHRSSHQ